VTGGQGPNRRPALVSGGRLPKMNGPGQCPPGSARRLYRSAVPGPFFGFTVSRSGRSHCGPRMTQAHAACRDSKWAQLCTLQKQNGRIFTSSRPDLELYFISRPELSAGQRTISPTSGTSIVWKPDNLAAAQGRVEAVRIAHGHNLQERMPAAFHRQFVAWSNSRRTCTAQALMRSS
jgi:hypothetical protein